MSSGRKPDIDNIYDEYIDQIVKIVAGTVKGFHRGDIITDLDRRDGGSNSPPFRASAPRAI